MKLKIKYFLFIGIIHLLLILFSFSSLKENKLLFIPAEIAILISLYLSYRIYKAFLKPLRLMQQGIDAIKDQDFNVSFALTHSKEMDQLIEVYNSMIQKIREERVSQKEQHYFLEKLIDASPNGIIVLDFNNYITTINLSAKTTLGLEEEELGLPTENINSSFLTELCDLKDDSSAIISKDGWKKYKCHSANFIHRGFERKFLLIEELSNEILETEKQAYGKVIRMMAHEVNNSLGAVNSILQSMKDSFPLNGQTEDEMELLNALSVAEGRNNRLGSFMKNFADVIRLPRAKKENLDLNEVCENIATLFKLQTQQRKINLEFQFEEQTCLISGDKAQIEQVLINIVKNAIEAIGENGTIKFQSKGKTLLVLDNGKGINQEVESHLFEPFFSSKPDGQGIGLTLIKEVLQEHEADFSLKTLENGWTCFSLNFPSIIRPMS